MIQIITPFTTKAKWPATDETARTSFFEMPCYLRHFVTGWEDKHSCCWALQVSARPLLDGEACWDWSSQETPWKLAAH